MATVSAWQESLQDAFGLARSFANHTHPQKDTVLIPNPTTQLMNNREVSGSVSFTKVGDIELTEYVPGGERTAAKDVWESVENGKLNAGEAKTLFTILLGCMTLGVLSGRESGQENPMRAHSLWFLLTDKDISVNSATVVSGDNERPYPTSESAMGKIARVAKLGYELINEDVPATVSEAIEADEANTPKVRSSAKVLELDVMSTGVKLG